MPKHEFLKNQGCGSTELALDFFKIIHATHGLLKNYFGH